MSKHDQKEWPRVLSFRKHSPALRWFFLAFIFFSAALLAMHLVAALFVPSVYSLPEIQDFTLPLLAGLLAMIASYYSIFHHLYRKKYQTFHDHLVIYQGEKKTVVPFAQIAKLKVSTTGFSFKLLMKNGKSHKIVAQYERTEYVLEAAMAFDSTFMAREKYESFRRRLILRDHLLARWLFKGQQTWFWRAHDFVMPVGFSLLIYVKQSRYLAISSPVSFIVFHSFFCFGLLFFMKFSAFAALDLWISVKTNHRMKLEPSNKRRDLTAERKIQRKFLPAYSLLVFGFLSAVYVFDFNRLETARVASSIPHLGLKRGESIWVDRRFNCIGCRFSLKKQDVVVFARNKEQIFGRLISLPLETLTRAPSATAEDVPAGMVLIQAGEEGEKLLLVSLKEIDGKAISDLQSFLRP